MLRSFEQIRCSVPPSRLLDAGENRAVVTGGGLKYRTQWHWHDCAMILMPASGTIAFRDERAGQLHGLVKIGSSWCRKCTRMSRKRFAAGAIMLHFILPKLRSRSVRRRVIFSGA